MSYAPIVLASRSPRRSQLLRQIGIPHEVLCVDFDEERLPGEAPRDYVERLARDKASHARAQHPGLGGRPLLAADTAVVLDTTIFGKPRDEQDCLGMLGDLSGRVHEVMTAIALHDGARLLTAVNVSRVAFRALSEVECRAYWATGEPADKAGGYAVQGRAAIFIRHIAGSYSGIMGLPLFETWELLAPLLGLTAGGRRA